MSAAQWAIADSQASWARRVSKSLLVRRSQSPLTGKLKSAGDRRVVAGTGIKSGFC